MGILADVTMERQRNGQWCWAAITSSVFRKLQQQAMSQEDIVCRMLANESCRLEPAPDICNIPFPLEIAIQQICQCLVMVQGMVGFAEIEAQIDGVGRPLPIAISFPGEFGSTQHYCLIKGCLNLAGNQEVVLLDPAHVEAGESHIPFADLVDGSLLGASWIQSFVLQ